MASTAERILVVESDPDISQVIARQALKPLGYDVTVMTQATEAIQAALENPPDLIIANLDLPDLGGKDVLAALSAQGVNAPLVVIAEKGEERRAIQAFRLGAADAILWPARDAEIVRVVERSLQPTRSHRVRRELYHQLEAAQADLSQRNRDIESILALTKAFSAGADPRRFLERLPSIALGLAQADVAWITVQDQQRRDFLLQGGVNLPPAWARKKDQPLDDGLSSMVIVSGRALTIHGQPLEKFKVAALGKSAAVLPGKVRNEVLTALIVVRKADQEIEASVLRLLQGLADLAAAAVLQSRLFSALRATAAAARQDSRNRARMLQSARAAQDHLQRIQAGEAGDLTKPQKDVLAALRISLEQITRSASKD
ncbi:MAG TPA: response regulator [Anaerolineales bacterium]|nr:response regulator [Anaerolineales bacterium]